MKAGSTVAFHAMLLPSAASFATKTDVAGGAPGPGAAIDDSTYTPPPGSTAIAAAANPRSFCHRIVFPSADSFVTRKAGEVLREELGMIDRM
jgi:hypothetical protein